MSEPQPPRPPEFKPGQATPQPYEPTPDYPPTSQFPPVNYAPPGQPPDYGRDEYPPTGYPPPSYAGQPASGPPGYAPPGHVPPPPRRSNKPLIAVIVAVSVLLCGGVITSGVLLVQRATEKVEEVAAPILQPTLPAVPTDAPGWPGFPGELPTELPTDLPGLPTDLPALPTDLPGLPGLDAGRKFTVTYEVKGDGPARIVYVERLRGTPKVLANVDLPWKVTTDMEGAAIVSIIAQRMGPGEGSITCRASVDGEEVVEQTTNGPVATTTCNKLVYN